MKTKVWMRLGVTVSVDSNTFYGDPEQAIEAAIQRGDYVVDGDSYVPNSTVEELVSNEQLPESMIDEEFTFEW